MLLHSMSFLVQINIFELYLSLEKEPNFKDLAQLLEDIFDYFHCR
ncbi:unnamed protein product [Arabidopsis halleri]